MGLAVKIKKRNPGGRIKKMKRSFYIHIYLRMCFMDLKRKQNKFCLKFKESLLFFALELKPPV